MSSEKDQEEKPAAILEGPGGSRLKREIKELMQTPLPGIVLVSEEENFTLIHACMVGPEKTPYEGGLFNFRLQFPPGYPMCPPKVIFLTTGSGRVRMNPNLYECGKVCVSILGTWDGPKWTAACGLSSVLLSIHSLFTEDPICNEPGFEKLRRTKSDIYNRYVTHETIRASALFQVKQILHEVSTLHPTIQQKMIPLFIENSGKYVKWCESLQQFDGGYELVEPYGKQITFRFASMKAEVEDCRKQCEQYLIENPQEPTTPEISEYLEYVNVDCLCDSDYVESYSEEDDDEEEECSDNKQLEEDSSEKSQVFLQEKEPLS